MYDQAAQLRRLMTRAGGAAQLGDAARRRVLMIVGGSPLCGATTVALHLSLALVQQGQRTVLIDADEGLGDIEHCCGLNGGLGLAEALEGECTIHEAVQRGPGGLQVVGGIGPIPSRRDRIPVLAPRLVPLLRALEAHTDWVVVDAGRGDGPLTEHLWREATLLLVVTTPDAAAVMETYTTFKSHWDVAAPTVDPLLFINQSDDDTIATDVHRRLNDSCRKFLGRGIGYGGYGPHDPLIREAAETGRPLAAAAAPFSEGCEAAAERVLTVCRATPSRRSA